MYYTYNLSIIFIFKGFFSFQRIYINCLNVHDKLLASVLTNSSCRNLYIYYTTNNNLYRYTTVNYRFFTVLQQPLQK